MKHQGWCLGLVTLNLFCFTVEAADPPHSLPPGSRFLEKSTLKISHNPAHKQADWVSYPLGPNELRNCVERKDNFRPDQAIPREERSELADYKGSGFDRGHLSPAGDNKWLFNAMSDSFLLSNISPQPPRFNQGIWSRLEGLVRAWALKMGGLEVTTGPILRDVSGAIGPGRVSIPRAYFKVLVGKSAKGFTGLAIRMPVNASGEISQFFQSIDALEAETGIDFAPEHPEEEKIEASFNPANWDLRATFKYLPCN
jgi:endonuclease G